MVFLSLNEPLEDFLKRDEETRIEETNWFLSEKGRIPPLLNEVKVGDECLI